jgi:AcrR family transcriptional regulator
MPKDTFYNLSSEKQNKIIDAATEEFTRNSLHKSRVSNIIQKANIPRGSFYQYFIDLEDLYFHVMNMYIDSIYESGLNFTERTNDLFEFAMLTFDYDYEAYTNDKRHKLMGNMMQTISENPEYMTGFNTKRIEYVERILDLMDTSNVVHRNKNELVRIYSLIQNLKRGVVHKSMMDKLSKKEAKNEFSWQMEILKNGIKVK